jgi:hypothetical protein
MSTSSADTLLLCADARSLRPRKTVESEYEPISHEEQDRAVNEIKEYLRLSASIEGPLPEGQTYTASTFLLEHGKTYYMNKETFTSEDAIPNRCYRNASNLALADNELTYVEGLINVNVGYIAHAWVVDKYNRIVHEAMFDIPGQTDEDRITGYFGVPFTLAYLFKTLYNNEMTGLLIERPSTHALYRDVYHKAVKKSKRCHGNNL